MRQNIVIWQSLDNMGVETDFGKMLTNTGNGKPKPWAMLILFFGLFAFNLANWGEAKLKELQLKSKHEQVDSFDWGMFCFGFLGVIGGTLAPYMSKRYGTYEEELKAHSKGDTKIIAAPAK